jgi:hypothetical protein
MSRGDYRSLARRFLCIALNDDALNERIRALVRWTERAHLAESRSHVTDRQGGFFGIR